MNKRDLLALAAEALAAKRDIMCGVAQFRRELRERETESRATSARHLIVVAETAAQIRQLRPIPVEDPIIAVERQGQAALTNMRIKSESRAEAHRHLRNDAKQAALDRAKFIEQVRRELPESEWDATVDDYDRQIFEGGEL